MQPARELISDSAMAFMAEEIRKGGGNEVFFVAPISGGMLTQPRVLARGNINSVPAIFHEPVPGEVVVHNHPSGDLTPSAPDIAVASRFGNNSVAFYIVDNLVERVYPVVNMFARKEIRRLEEKHLAEALRPGGALAASLPQLEDRPGQHAMLHAVAQAFNQGEISLLEAGTGTGKTLAYLLPAVDYARKNKQRVIVATHTINLQEQILNKDAPALRAVFGDDLRVVLVKGRGNYMSKRRAAEFAQSLPLLVDDADHHEAKALVDWTRKTEDGSRSDLPFQVSPALWEKVQSETDNCLRQRCPTFSECFFYRARRTALEADVLVSNHHLLFADLAVRSAMGDEEGGLLPVYKHVIIDEAHHTEEVATEYFGSHVTRIGFQRALHRLYRESPKGERGSLVVLQRKLAERAAQLPEGISTLLAAILTDRVRPAAAAAEHTFQVLFDHIHDLARKGEQDGGEGRTLRLAGAAYERDDVKALQADVETALKDMNSLLGPAVEFLRKASPFTDELAAPGPLKEFEAALARLTAVAEGLREALLADAPGSVRWIETQSFNPRIVRACAAPIDVGGLLAENLFARHDTVIMTSATLAVAGKMNFLRKRTGVALAAQERVQEHQFASPFDYELQARLFVTNDLPSPDQAGYDDALAEALPRLLVAAGGRAFVLFTSFRSLQRQHQAAAATLAAAGIRSFKQGEMTRDRLLKAFREDTRSVLFGTDSFWEGVDVEGESLSTVILTRLPFRVPTEPVTVARAEAIEAAGGRPFNEFTIPTAVIKFRQGFGRLIRSKTDRGVVIVTDNRLISKSYGKSFLKSLPPVPLLAAKSREIEEHILRFFAE